MTERITTNMDVTSWDEQTISEGNGTKLTRTTMGQSCSGDLVGTSSSELVMYYSSAGTATIVGFLTVDGTLLGRTGSFVLQSTGAFDGSRATAELAVVEGSGTGELTGVTGVGTSVAPSGPTAFVELDLDIAAR